MKRNILYILLIAVCGMTYAQTKTNTATGKVTFVTSKNAYVRFEATDFIKVGDTLQLKSTQSRCLKVVNKSSNSVVCTFLGECPIQKGDEVLYTYEIVEKKEPEGIIEPKKEKVVVEEKEEEEKLTKQRISGRFSIASYNTFSDIRETSNRLASSLALNVDNISDSKFSFETFVNYRQNFLSNNPNNRQTQFLRIFNAALTYEATPTLSIVAGRKINPRAASLGAVDGLQVEKRFGKNFAGVIAGYRPDLTDFSFNTEVMQFGAYIGRSINTKNLYSETTIGAMEQRNKGAIDRRFLYLQHYSTINRKWNLFSSAELDIFNPQVPNLATNSSVRLTNLYTSIRYRFNRKVNASLSFDSRKRVIFYETFQTELEQLLNNDIARQGVVGRVNYRYSNNIFTGMSYGRRFQKDGNNASNNFHAFVSMSRVPKIGGRASLNVNINSSNYLTTTIGTLRYAKPFMNRKLNADFYYRYVNYGFNNELIPSTTQHVIGTNLFYNITRKLTFSISGEYAKSNVDNVYRFYTRLIKRF